MKDLSRISVVLPSLDPDEKLNAVIDGLLEYGFTDIILVNDGSRAENLHYFTDAAAAHPEIHFLQHEVNRGKGAALKTAFTWFLANRPDGLGVVTVDGDNQHHPADTRACCERMLETGHIVLGCRDFTLDNVPARSRFGNHVTSAVFRIFVGMTVSDTQTGLRAIPRDALEILTAVKGDRFEYETNMLLAMKDNGLPFEEVKIRTVYIEENASSHFHPIRDSWRIYKLILAHFFRYTLSSLTSALVDTAAFSLLGWVLRHWMEGFALTAAAGVGARIIPVEFLSEQKAGLQEPCLHRPGDASLLLSGHSPDVHPSAADPRRVRTAAHCGFPICAAHPHLCRCDGRSVRRKLYDSAALGFRAPEAGQSDARS